MASRGRKPIPTEVKRRRGNPGQHRLAEPIAILPATESVPRPPKGLGKSGKALWRELWRTAQAWLAPSDAPLVRLLCRAADEADTLRALVESEGYTFVTAKGYRGVHPAVSQLRAVEQQMSGWLSLLGLTPTDRARLGLVEVRRVTKLADFLAGGRDAD